MRHADFHLKEIKCVFSAKYHTSLSLSAWLTHMQLQRRSGCVCHDYLPLKSLSATLDLASACSVQLKLSTHTQTLHVLSRRAHRLHVTYWCMETRGILVANLRGLHMRYIFHMRNQLCRFDKIYIWAVLGNEKCDPTCLELSTSTRACGRSYQGSWL